MRCLILLSLLCAVAQAKEVLPLLTSANGSDIMHAKPIAVSDGKIVFRKAGGKTFTASLEKFSNKDQKNLCAWMDAMKKNHHARLVDGVNRADPLRVLFIGNSYSFKIPKRFDTIAKAEGKKVYVEQVTKGGWTLRRHAKSEDTIRLIVTGKWDVVVLQEQSQVPAFPEHQRTGVMDDAIKKLVLVARKSNAIPVFFLTWGRRDGDQQNAAMYPNDTMEAMQKRLAQGYTNAAKYAGGAHIVPVGKVWTSLKKAEPGSDLYAKDGSHPAKLGNLLGASVFYTALYNELPKLSEKGTSKFATHLKAATLMPLPYPLSQ